MQLWKIIEEVEYRTLRSTGRLITEERFVDPDFLPAFRWMVDQMRARIGNPPEDVRLPQWAWLQWRSSRQKKPDLRVERHRVPAGRHVLLELDIHPDRLLISDFERWHFVLNGWYLPFADEDLENERPLGRRERNSAIIRSWEAIFDLSDNIDSKLWGEPDDRSVQATFWDLRPDDIVSAREFVSAVK